MKQSLKSLVLLALMLMAAAVGFLNKPTIKLADSKPTIELEKIIPSRFGQWREEAQGTAYVVNPQQQQVLNEIYSQTLSKTYVNAQGYRVMLSIAYGGDQSRDLQVHRPEVCYSVQGFQVSKLTKVLVPLGGDVLPAMRLETRLGNRIEPVTYWVRIGDKLVRGNIEQGLARVSYGLQGYIADGLLFRVSSIDKDSTNAYAQQDRFVSDLLQSVSAPGKTALLGQAESRS